MAVRFNVPPGWPPVPQGWLPPPGWQPDPTWPPAPTGWTWYVDDDVEPTVVLDRPPVDGARPESWVRRHKALTAVAAAVVVLLGIVITGAIAGSSDPVAQQQAAASTSTPSPTTAEPTTDAATTPPSPTPPTSTAAAPAPVLRVTMPNLVGKRLSTAEARLWGLGVESVDALDASPEGRIPLMPTNWVVTGQSVPAGQRINVTTSVTLEVKKPSDGEGTQIAAGVVPDVVCMDLQAAQDSLQAAGFYNLGSDDGSGQGRMQILDRDWVVISQSVRAGSTPSPLKRIVLASVKYGEPTGASGCRS